MKRVILTVTNDLTLDQRLHKVCISLQKLGYEPVLVGRNRRDSQPLRPRPYRTVRLRMFAQRGKFFYAEFNFRLFWYLLFRRTDILTANDLDTLLPVFLVARLRGKRLVYDAHELFTEVPEVVARPRIRKAWLGLERLLFPRLRHISTVNEFIGAEYETRYRKKIEIVSNLPFFDWQPAPPDRPSNVLLYQGHIKAGRGIELMLRALPLVPDAEFWLVGGGLQFEEMKQLAQTLGIAERVRFFGFLPFEELPALTRQATLGLSLEDPAYGNTRLSSPNKLFDYVQAAVPVVVADLPVHRRMAEEFDVGAVLEERTPEALASLLNQLLGDPDRLAQLTRNTERAARALCWEAQLPTLQKLYAES